MNMIMKYESCFIYNTLYGLLNDAIYNKLQLTTNDNMNFVVQIASFNNSYNVGGK